MSVSYEYRVIDRWCGWWGGFGSPIAMNRMLEQQAKDGWRLVGTQSKLRGWNWLIPRPMILFFFERAT